MSPDSGDISVQENVFSVEELQSSITNWHGKTILHLLLVKFGSSIFFFRETLGN